MIQTARRSRHSGKPPFNLFEQFRTDFVARIALDAEKAALFFVVLEEGRAGFLELLQPLLPRVDRIVGPLRQRFPGYIVFAVDLWRVEIGVVYSPRRCVYPA